MGGAFITLAKSAIAIGHAGRVTTTKVAVCFVFRKLGGVVPGASNVQKSPLMILVADSQFGLTTPYGIMIIHLPPPSPTPSFLPHLIAVLFPTTPSSTHWQTTRSLHSFGPSSTNTLFTALVGFSTPTLHTIQQSQSTPQSPSTKPIDSLNSSVSSKYTRRNGIPKHCTSCGSPACSLRYATARTHGAWPVQSKAVAKRLSYGVSSPIRHSWQRSIPSQ